MTSKHRSLLPPQIVRKLERLPDDERRMYAQELRGTYETSITAIPARAEGIADEWAASQREHFENIIEELIQYIEG